MASILADFDLDPDTTDWELYGGYNQIWDRTDSFLIGSNYYGIIDARYVGVDDLTGQSITVNQIAATHSTMGSLTSFTHMAVSYDGGTVLSDVIPFVGTVASTGTIAADFYAILFLWDVGTSYNPLHYSAGALEDIVLDGIESCTPVWTNYIGTTEVCQ